MATVVGSVQYDVRLNLASLKKDTAAADKLLKESYDKQSKAAQSASKKTNATVSKDAQERVAAVQKEAQATASTISKYSPQIQSQFLSVERANLQVTNASNAAAKAITRYGENSTQAQSAIQRLSIATQNQSQQQNKLNTMLNEGDKSTGRFSSAMTRAGVVAGAAAAVVGTVLNKAISMVSNSIGAAVSRVDTLNNSKRTFENMGIGAAESDKSMKALVKSINGLPTPLDSAVRGMTALTATYSDIDKGQKVFSALNNAILGFGGSAAMVDNAIMQLSQLPLDGPLDAQTWNSLRNSGLTPVLTAMAKESGTSVSKMKEAFGSGELKVQDFINRLIKMDKEGGGGLKSLQKIALDSTNGIGTGFSNMQTAISRGIAKIIESVGSQKISNAINNIGKAFEGALKGIASFINALDVLYDWILGAFIGDVTGDELEHGWFRSIIEMAAGMKPLIDSLREVKNSVLGAFSGDVTSESLKSGWFKSVIEIAEGIKSLSTSILPAVQSLAAGIYNGIKPFAQILIPVMRSLAEIIISAVLPAISKLLSAINSVASFISRNQKAIETLVIIITSLLIPAMVRFGVQSMIAFGQYAAGVAIASAQTLLAAARMAVAWLLALGPIGIIVAAVGAAVALIIANWDTVKGFVLGVWEGIKNAVSSVFDWVKNNWPLLLSILLGPFGLAVSLIIKNFDTIKNAAQNVWNWIKGAFSTIGDVVAGAFKFAVNGVLSYAENVINGFVLIINGAIAAIDKITPGSLPRLGRVSVPRLAEGGIVPATPGGILANIGEGREAEAVIPLSKLEKMIGSNGSSNEPATVVKFAPSPSILREAALYTIELVNQDRRAKGLTEIGIA